MSRKIHLESLIDHEINDAIREKIMAIDILMPALSCEKAEKIMARNPNAPVGFMFGFYGSNDGGEKDGAYTRYCKNESGFAVVDTGTYRNNARTGLRDYTKSDGTLVREFYNDDG